MPGPEESRLIQALDGTHPGSASGGAEDWDACAGLLAQVSMSLAAAQMPVQPGDAGAATSAAITESFHRSADAMSKRADKMRDGKAALTRASEAIKTANEAHEALGPEPGAPSYTPHADPNSPAGIKKHNAYLADVAAYDAKREHREKVAKKHADDLDAAFEKSSATMKEIHGIPDPPPPPQGYSGGTGGSGGSGAKAPAHHTSTPSSTSGGHDHDGGLVPHHPPTDTGTDTGTDYVNNHPGTDDGGSSQGNVPTTTGPTIGGSVPSPTGSTGTGVSGTTGLGLAGAAAGGVGGGLLGTGLATGGIRGGGVAPITAGGGTAASGVRGIGATSRAGVSGTLGRSGTMSSTGTGTGTTSRGAGGARSGASAAGRGSGGRGGAGSRGAAGRRGAATGAGAGGRSGRSKDDEKKTRHGEFDDTEDWIDDDDAAPGIID